MVHWYIYMFFLAGCWKVQNWWKYWVAGNSCSYYLSISWKTVEFLSKMFNAIRIYHRLMLGLLPQILQQLYILRLQVAAVAYYYTGVLYNLGEGSLSYIYGIKLLCLNHFLSNFYFWSFFMCSFGRKWVLPSRRPDGTKVYKNQALRTPFVTVSPNSHKIQYGVKCLKHFNTYFLYFILKIHMH